MRKLILLLTIAVTLTACQNDRFEALEEADLLNTRVTNYLNGEIESLRTQLAITTDALNASIADNTALIAENTAATVSNVLTIEANYDALVEADAENLEAITKSVNEVESNLSAAIEDAVVELEETIAALKVELQLAIADGDQYVVNNLTVQITAAEQAARTAIANINFPTFDATSLNLAISELQAVDVVLTQGVADNLSSIESLQTWLTIVAGQVNTIMTETIQAINNKLNPLLSRVSTLENNGRANANDIESIRDAISVVQTTISSNTLAIESIDLTPYATTVSVTFEINEAVNDINQTIANVSTTLSLLPISAIESAITALETDVANNATAITSNTMNIETLEASLIFNINRINALTIQIAGPSGIFARLDALELNPVLTTAQIAEIATIRTDLTTLNTEVASNTAALNGIDVSTLATAADLAAANVNINNLIPRVNAHFVRLENIDHDLQIIETNVQANANAIVINTAAIASNTLAVERNSFNRASIEFWFHAEQSSPHFWVARDGNNVTGGTLTTFIRGSLNTNIPSILPISNLQVVINQGPYSPEPEVTLTPGTISGVTVYDFAEDAALTLWDHGHVNVDFTDTSEGIFRGNGGVQGARISGWNDFPANGPTATISYDIDGTTETYVIDLLTSTTSGTSTRAGARRL